MSLPWQRLIRTDQAVYFGSVEGVGACRGEPASAPAGARYERKFASPDAKAPAAINQTDFQFKAAHLELIQKFAGLPDGVVVTLEIRYGLPARLVRVKPLAYHTKALLTPKLLRPRRGRWYFPNGQGR